MDGLARPPRTGATTSDREPPPASNPTTSNLFFLILLATFMRHGTNGNHIAVLVELVVEVITALAAP